MHSTPPGTGTDPSPKPANTCFGCGDANPDGLRLIFEQDADDGTARSTVRIPARYIGAPGVLHGGIVALLLDEVMAKVNSALGDHAPTVRLDVEYLRPVPAEADLVLKGHRVRRQGRRITNEGVIEDSNGKTLARAQGDYMDKPEGWPRATPAR